MTRRSLPTLETSVPIASAPSRDGALIMLRWAEDFEAPNRGFISHEMSAWEAGQRVGYLRTGFVPKSQLAAYLPTVWHHSSSFGGRHIPEIFATGFGPAIHPDDLDREAFAAFRNRITDRTHRSRTSPDWPDYATMMAALAKHPVLRASEARFAGFRAFHVDRPLVDFVNTRASRANDVPSDNRGRGIALMLYAATAMVLGRSSLRLHASGIQSPEAGRLWGLFAQRGWVLRRGSRMLLNPARMPSPTDILGALA